MSFNSTQLQDRLLALAAEARPSRYVVAFSGGLDSSVLLHALQSSTKDTATPVLALHVDHGLQEDAGAWEAHCRETASAMTTDYKSLSIVVPQDSGHGPEAAARQARYEALQQCMQAGDWLLSAHHQEDQAETLLLNILRGSGLAGLAGIGEMQPFGPGFLVRPLLHVARKDLEAYAAEHGLDWLEDPSNADRRFDRNFLRHDILPALAERWPAASSRLARSAELAAEAATLLGELADDDLHLSEQGGRLEIQALSALSDARQRNVLRRALKRAGLPSAPATRLRQILDELIPAKADAEPLVSWSGTEVRRYRKHIYLLPALDEWVAPDEQAFGTAGDTLNIGSLGQLLLLPDAAPGIRADVVNEELTVRFRTGGEEIRPIGHQCTHKLKKLLQQKGVVPWMRDKIPLLWSGSRLVAVGDLWIAAEFADKQGLGVEWRNHPAIF
jgi:tRNA(Ile)-lysidine synthase